MSNTIEADRIITINKTFDAPIQLVWEAWTKPEHIANWWGPKGMQIDVVEHNFEVNGSWKYTMPMPDGNLFVSEGVYSVIEELKQIRTTADFRPMTEGVELECLFEAIGEQTNFTFNVIHPTAEYAKAQEKMGIYSGWGSAFDRLAEFLSDK